MGVILCTVGVIVCGMELFYGGNYCIPRTEFGGYYGFVIVAPRPRPRRRPRPRPPPQRFSCERSTGCSCSRIIFKFGMKVRYGKAKTPIVFGVGGVIVAMVTTFFVEIF